ncbi:Cyclin-L1 [Armadillidium nasatum]|uniref:Cyclin-L1 n=1 Tax=Armadillidium nasatum TaxID=96803 RepID=A0A5N5SWU8_9CRUS|nr:Cyclin-L1 [Armadillidium nasatum]
MEATNLLPVAAKKFGNIIMTLDNVLIPVEKLNNSPSQQDGLDPETELDLRILGCELIQTSGILLKLPQVAMATGQVLFQRFYYSKSFVRCPVEITAMACITLAWKMEVGQMEIRHVINVFNHMKQFRNGENWYLILFILDRNYVALKNQVIRAETRLLKELGFCCHVKLPHKISIMYLRFLVADDNKKLVQSTWNFMNDSARTDVCVRYSPETIACSCIWLAGRQLKIPLPENPPWYHVFGVNLSDIEKIAASIMKLYTRKKTKLKVLETKVEEVRLKLQEARLRKKAVSAVVSSEEGTSFSSASGSSSPSNNSSLSKSSSPSESSSPSKSSNSSSKSSSPSGCNATSSRRRKRSCSERRKSNGSSRSKSRSPSRRARKKAKRSHKRSISRSRSRSHSRERYYKKKYSRSPSLAVTPRPRYIRNREGRSVSRSRLRSRSPHPNYDKKYEKKYSKQNYRYDKLERYDKHYKYVKDYKDKYAKDYRRYDHKDKSVKDLRICDI